MGRLGGALALTGGLLAVGVACAAPASLRSGPQVGGRPLPFTSNLVSGPHRGEQHCYICDLKDEPAILVFARNRTPATAKLLQDLRDAVRQHRDVKLFAWTVFVGVPAGSTEGAVEQDTWRFVRENEATALPVSVLGDIQGPPGYLIAPDAEVTVIGFRNNKVIFNEAYRAKEWSGKAADHALKHLPELLKAGA